MADQRSVLKELRFLEEKRRTQGLSPEEQARLDALRDVVGETAPAGVRPGFDVNAAAARLRDSLLPAGLRRPPPAPEVLEPEPEPEPLGADAFAVDEPMAEPWAEAEAAPMAPAAGPADRFFDPASLAGDDAPQALEANAWDPNAPYDPNAAPWDPAAAVQDPNAAAYDPNAAAWNPDDPSAQAWDPATAAYDPNAPGDPNAQAWDPNAAPLDPATWDPNAPWDPNAAPLDPAAWDPNAVPQDAAAWDPNAVPQDPAAWDPNAAPQDPAAWDPNAVPQDAAAWDPNAVPQDPAAWDPNAVPQDPAAWDPNAVPQDPAAWDPNAVPQDAAAWDSNAVPQDPAAWDPNAVAQDPAAWDPNGGFDPADLAIEATAEPGFELTGPDALPPLDFGASDEPTASLGVYGELAPANPGTPTTPDDAALEALLPFDPAAASAIGLGDLASGFEPSPARSFLSPPSASGADADAFSASPASWPEPPPAAPEPNAFETSPQLTAEASAEWHPDDALDGGFELASHGSFEPEPTLEPSPELDLGIGAEPALELAAEPSLDLSAEFTFEPEAEPLADAAPALNTFPAPEPVPDATVEIDLPAADFDDPALAEPVAAAEPEIPTIDGADILEEIVPDESEPLAAAAPSLDFDVGEVTAPVPELAPEAPPAAPAATRLAGQHRVVVHTVEGHVKRGVLEDVELGAPEIALGGQTGAAETIATENVKTIFFMLAPGERPPAPEGQRVRVTFRDGRQVAGFSPDYREGATGFFMIPAETRTNTGRIWVYAAAVKTVAVG